MKLTWLSSNYSYIDIGYILTSNFIFIIFFLGLPIYIASTYVFNFYLDTRSLCNSNTPRYLIKTAPSYAFLFKNSTFLYSYTLVLIILISYNNIEMNLWFNHFFISNLPYNFLLVFVTLTLVTVNFTFSGLLVNNFLFFGITVFTLLPTLVLFIFSATNFYSMIILIELLTTFVYLNLITMNFFKSINNFSHYIASFVIFFWVGMIASISLFLFLILFSTVVGNNNNLLFLNSPHSSNSVQFLSIFLFFIFFFKLGLPPFIIWKFSFFQKIFFSFLVFYNIIYLFILFNYFYFLIFFFKGVFLFNLTNPLFLITFILILLVFVPLLLKMTNLGFFLVISTSATLLLIIWSTITQLCSVSDLFINNINILFNYSIFNLSYFYIYIFSTLFFLLILQDIKISSLNITINNLIDKQFSALYPQYIILFLILVFISLSGLPPFLLFFIKLFLLTSFLTSSGFFISLFLIVYLFTVLLFYFRNIRFFLLQSVQFSKNFVSRTDTKYFNEITISFNNIYMNLYLVNLLKILLLVGLIFVADLNLFFWLIFIN